jgi:hypothetical protein
MTTDISISDHSIDVETPQERAQRRVRQLHRCAAGVMDVLADIYRDDDWRHLTDRIGHPYRTFAAFIQDQLGGSASAARRYQQGIINLVVPLQQITEPDTTIPVTSTDVARLGQDGARTVIERAPDALHGQSDQTHAIRRLIDTVLADDVATAMIAAADQEPDDGLAAGDLVPTSPLPAKQDPADEANQPDCPHDAETPLPQSDSAASTSQSHDTEQFKQTLTTLLTTDPVALATQIQADPQIASDCVTGAQLLARISQLIR